jgi:threonine dehydrogenase-like Zn-dependent dehydrogenase
MRQLGKIGCVAALAAMLFGGGAAWAGDLVSLRLVRADNQGGVDAAVKDVQQAMGKDFAYKGFHLEAQGAVQLSASKPVTLGGYTVECSGSAQALVVKVSRDGKAVLSTTVALAPGKPLILGGWPAAGGARQMLVLVAQ